MTPPQDCTHARLYILCGPPFSGKSTLARAIAGATGCTLVELDAINTAHGVGLDGAPISPAQWDDSYRTAYRLVTDALDAGRSVIFDATNHTRDQRDVLRALAKRHRTASCVIFVAVDLATVRARWQTNRRSPQRNDVRDEDFANVVDHFEPPTPDERLLMYDGMEPLQDWIARHYRSLA